VLFRSEQVTGAITQMDDMTQQNAALVEEAAATSEAMQEQAGYLSEAVSVFKLEESKVSIRTAVAKPTIKSKASTAVAPHTRERKLVKAEKDMDSDWKEF
jgi:methyl-accepting chemotaxis protein